jgi:hypothetical protein
MVAYSAIKYSVDKIYWCIYGIKEVSKMHSTDGASLRYYSLTKKIIQMDILSENMSSNGANYGELIIMKTNLLLKADNDETSRE